MLRSLSLYSVRVRKYTDQKNSEYVHFLHSESNSFKVNIPFLYPLKTLENL